ncbi:glycosyltransferase [Halarcobacter ebronensis]|uniref:Glycosyl transferase n=1 Tax=Halarcobacter ebronensis TaxID=1462615 RepID=A0A4Q1ALH9_9BACT|nr:glycosyltransferase [Halarcobacter ebronensis]QKF83302.1 glycosyltransferase, family 1 [Halarcobacter ebronensis]RXK05864.1 glycosyl transferase [Halarcobacter ebronensis]
MKIIIFTQNLDFGGVQKSVYLLANYLKKEYDLTIILAEDNKKIRYKIDGINILQIKTPLINIKDPNVGEKLYKYRIIELDNLLNKVKPNILISYEDYNNLITLNCEYKCKKIISCRVSIKDSYEKRRIHLLESEFYYNMIKKLYKKADRIITVSESIKNELIDDFQLDNIITIYNGIVHNNDVVSSKYSNFILNIGRLHTQKGQKDLIKAFNEIKDKVDVNLIIVGDGNMKEELLSLVNRFNLGERVLLVGYDDPYKYIKNCKLFVFPSYYEGFSNTILEVMSCEKNIVSYNYKGSKEILYEDNIVPLGNIKKLSEKILYYLNNERENIDCSKKLFEKSQNFTLEKTLQNYKKEIEALCVE